MFSQKALRGLGATYFLVDSFETRFQPSRHNCQFQGLMTQQKFLVCLFCMYVKDRALFQSTNHPTLDLYDLWKKEQATQKDHKDVIKLFREKIRRAKA